MKQETEVLNTFIRRKGLRFTPQREKILKTFLSSEGHLSVEELFNLSKKQDATIGYTTVYRTMKLFEEAGLAEKLDFGDGLPRYEHKYGHKHHDHFICIKCGKCLEAMSPKIEKSQEALAKKYGFKTIWHKLQIFGICKKCR